MRSNTDIADQASQLRALVNSQYQTYDTRRPCSISIISGKGGVGKSMIAANAAIALSQRGKNVLLIDGNSNRSSLDILFGVAPKERLGNFLRGEIEFDETVFQALPNLSLLPASSGEHQYPPFAEETARRIIENTFSHPANFDFVIIDTPSGINEEVHSFSALSDETILVSTSEPTSITDTYAAAKILLTKKPNHPMFLLLNNIIASFDAEDAVMKLNLAMEHFLQYRINYLGFLPNESIVISSIQQQRPWKLQNANSAISIALDSIIEKIISRNTQRINKVNHE